MKAILNKYLKRIYLVPSGGFAGLNNDHIADFLDKKYCLGGYEGVWPGWCVKFIWRNENEIVTLFAVGAGVWRCRE